MHVEYWPDGREKTFRCRVVTFGKPREEWRSTRAEAMHDAVRLGLASWDQSRREYYLAVPVSIEHEVVPLPPLPLLSTPSSPRRWTADDDAQLRAMLRRNAFMSEIVRALGRTQSAIRSRITKLGISARVPRPLL